MAKQLYDYWFVQFDFPNEEGKPYKSSGGAMVWNEKLKREIPQGWDSSMLQSICTIKRGASPRPIDDFMDESHKGMPWVKISDATNSNSPFMTTIKEHIILDGVPQSVKVIPNTLIVSNSATPGIPKFIQIEACVHDGWLVLTDYQEIYKYYLYYVIKMIRHNLLHIASGSIFKNLKTDYLKEFICITPSTEILSKYHNLVKPIMQEILLLQQDTEALTKQRDELLPLLMNGQASVNYHLSARSSISFDISVLFLNFTNGKSLYETICLDYQRFALPLHSKEIHMGLFKKIKDIFSNDKGKETNTQENVSLPSSVNVPQQSTKQPLVMPGVTEVIKARSYLNANDTKQTKCQYESAVQKGYSLNLEPYNWLLRHYTSKERWSDAKRVLLLVPAKFSQDALIVEFREVIRQREDKLPKQANLHRNITTKDTLANRYKSLIAQLPEFDFYTNGNDTLFSEDVPVCHQIEDIISHIENELRKAKVAEKSKDYITATNIYEELLANGYWKPEPYNRLLYIYDKAGLTNGVKELLVLAISFFENQQKKQKQELLRLADKYKSRAYAEAKINQGKTVAYFDGFFEIYMPFPDIDVWKRILADTTA